MRHINTFWIRWWQNGKLVKRTITKPHAPYSTFSSPDSSRVYIKVIQHIADHPGCKRFDAIVKTTPRFSAFVDRVGVAKAKKFLRGQSSTLFADLLYKDYIDYNDKFEYHVTDKGLALLKEAYLNDMKRIVNK